MSDRRDGPRLDALMSVLVTLHECGVITDPAISTELHDNGKAVTIEFLLDYDRERAEGLPTP